MDGGTTFHFVTEGIHAALERAAEAANGRDIRLGGGVETIQQYLRAGLVDEMHLAISRFFSAREKRFSRASMPWNSDTNAPSMLRRPLPRMSFSPAADEVRFGSTIELRVPHL